MALGACGGAAPHPNKDERAVKGFDPKMRSALEQTLGIVDTPVPGEISRLKPS